MLLTRSGYRLLALATVSFLFWSATGFAQKPVNPAPNIKFGSITREQFATSPVDSTAEAVVLYAYGEVSFEANDGTVWIYFTQHIREKIRKKSAYDRATIQVRTWRSNSGQHEYVTEFEGYTYNITDGSVTIDKLAKTGHFTEKVSDNLWLEKYTLPNVHEGSIIEYQYTLRTPFTVNYNPRSWQFQQDIPVNWSEYRITIPDYFYYKILQTGYWPMLVNEHKTTTVDLYPGQNGASASAYRFAMKDIPAFHNESYITTKADYMAKIDLELSRYQWSDLKMRDFSVDWPSLDRTLLDESRFGGQIRRTGFLRETAKTLLSQQADTLGRIKAAYDFIRHTIKWDNTTGLFSGDTKSAFDNKKGDAADINLMLIALLREMDFEANPVILSTRSHGRMNETYALLKNFDYVIAQVSVGGKDLLLDATDAFLVPGMLPLHCLNGKGRLIHPRNARFISLNPTERDSDAFTGTFTITDEGEVTGTIKQSHGGYSGLTVRKAFATEGKSKYLESVRKKRSVWQIEQADFSGADEKSGVFNENYTITIPEACGRAGARLYLRPMLTEGHGGNPFKETERLYPVDFGVQKEETFIATYTLPIGFQVEEMPKPVSMVLPDNGGRFVYQVIVNGENQLQVISRIILRKSVYLAGEYGPLRELFSRIVAKHAEQIVLKRGTIAEKK